MRSAALLLLLTGCLTVPDAQQAQCTQNSDCNTSLGEVCDQGLCWGGPPSGEFAAIVAPPSDRADLISVEHAMQTLPVDGQLGNVALEAPVTITGRIEPFCPAAATCASTTIAATITVTRDALFPGGPEFKTVVTAKDGLPRGSNSFTIAVPRTNGGDPDYIVTIVPDGNGDVPPSNGMTSAAELAPPGLINIRATNNVDTGTIVLGSETSVVVTGSLVDGASHSLGKYRVVVRGRLTPNGALTEVSTIDYTPNGQYSVTLATGALPPYTIEARPYDQNVVAPTLYLTEIDAVGGAHTLAQPPALGNKKSLAIAVNGLSHHTGSVDPVGGAHVVITGTYDPPLGGAARAVLSVAATTGDDGIAHVTLLDGASLSGTYKLRVVPAAGSELGVIYDTDFALDDTMPVRLPSRISLNGHVIGRDGSGAGKVAITARPSLRFAWSLDPTAQEFLGEIPAATAVTEPDGGFAISVDPALATVWGRYDLDFVSPTGMDTSWTAPGLEVPHDASLTSVSVGDQHMPDTAYLHGHITDPSNFAVTGGELRIFQLVTDTTLCSQVPYGPADCPIPATLLGHATSDTSGAIRLALPR